MDVSSILWSSNKLNHMKINVKHLKLPNIIIPVALFLMVNISVLGVYSGDGDGFGYAEEQCTQEDED